MLDHRRVYPIALLWGELTPGAKVPIIFDAQLRIIVPFLDYAISIAKQKSAAGSSSQAYKSLIEGLAYALKDAAEFMRSRRITWRDFDDDRLTAYRSWSYKRTAKNARGKDDLSAKRSVNIRLRHLYRCFAWIQERALLIQGFVGWNACRIRSTLPSLHQEDDGRRMDSTDREKYPLCYRRVGEGSRTTRQHFLSDQQADEVEAHLMNRQDPFVAERNILMLRIVRTVGLRRASVNSLTVDDFSDEAIADAERAQKDLRVTPAVQKFGHQDGFDVPLVVAHHLSRFIKTSRAERMDANQWNESLSERRVFFSATTGKPLSNGAISKLFRPAFRASGAPKGSGLHSGRRGFATANAALELAVRQRDGRSTAPEDVMLPVSRRLGHSSIDSIDPYIDANLAISNNSLEAKLRKEVLAKDIALHEAKTAVARLEAQVRKMQTAQANESRSAEALPGRIRRDRRSSTR